MVQFRAFAPQVVWCVADSANIDQGEVVMLTGVYQKDDPTPGLNTQEYVPKVDVCTASKTSVAYGIALDGQSTQYGWVPIVVSGMVKGKFKGGEDIAAGDVVVVSSTAGALAEASSSGTNDENCGAVIGWACQADSDTSAADLLDVMLMPKGVGLDDDYL